MARITKRFVEAAEPKADGKRQYLWDDEIKGFGLEVLATGVKSYIYQYRNNHQLDRRITIGKHGKFTPHQARETAWDYRQAVSEGRDPLAEKHEQKLTPTVSELLDAYLGSEAFGDKAPSTQANDKGRVERHLKPLLGRTQINALTKESIERARNAIRDGETIGISFHLADGGVINISMKADLMPEFAAALAMMWQYCADMAALRGNPKGSG